MADPVEIKVGMPVLCTAAIRKDRYGHIFKLYPRDGNKQRKYDVKVGHFIVSKITTRGFKPALDREWLDVEAVAPPAAAVAPNEVPAVVVGEGDDIPSDADQQQPQAAQESSAPAQTPEPVRVTRSRANSPAIVDVAPLLPTHTFVRLSNCELYKEKRRSKVQRVSSSSTSTPPAANADAKYLSKNCSVSGCSTKAYFFCKGCSDPENGKWVAFCAKQDVHTFQSHASLHFSNMRVVEL
jgi:hypothetical protein